MRYTSTRNATVNVSFVEALTTGYAPDGGLFVPKGELPQLDGYRLRLWQKLDYPELMQAVLRLFIDIEEVSDDELQSVCQEALQGFHDPHHAVPLVALGDKNHDRDESSSSLKILHVAELFHGPTYCFKDLGMRAVLRLLDVFGRHRHQGITLLVSTTGDTGPAAARAVADNYYSSSSSTNGLKLAVHYPHGQISNFQRRQMTCLKSPNIQVIAFEGGGDDMDAPIKSFLQQPQHDKNVVRTGVNSYNIGRPITQMVIYVWCYLRMAEYQEWDIPDDLSASLTNTSCSSSINNHCLDVILPTGAMGNVTAAFMTKRMGLPLGKLYAAVNANDITDRVIRNGDFSKSSSMVRTQSEAINIQVPYNFERILYYITNGNADYVRSFYENRPEHARTLTPQVHEALVETFGSVSITDEEMQTALRHTYETHQYLCDPHTAVAVAGITKLHLLTNHHQNRPLMVMATASPCKFEEAVTAAVGPDVWNAYYAAMEPALDNNNNNMEEIPPLFYGKVEGSSLEETQAHWTTLLKDVLDKLESK